MSFNGLSAKNLFQSHENLPVMFDVICFCKSGSWKSFGALVTRKGFVYNRRYFLQFVLSKDYVSLSYAK